MRTTAALAASILDTMVDQTTIIKVMRELGRRGGKKGGKRRLETMTAEERKEIARKAGLKSAEVRAKKAAQKKQASEARAAARLKRAAAKKAAANIRKAKKGSKA